MFPFSMQPLRIGMRFPEFPNPIGLLSNEVLRCRWTPIDWLNKLLANIFPVKSAGAQPLACLIFILRMKFEIEAKSFEMYEPRSGSGSFQSSFCTEFKLCDAVLGVIMTDVMAIDSEALWKCAEIEKSPFYQIMRWSTPGIDHCNKKIISWIKAR